MIAPFAVAAALVTVRDGFLPPEYQNIYFFQYLSLRWYWHWYVIAILVYWVVVLFLLFPANTRAALRKQKERHRKVYRRLRARSDRPPVVIYQGRPDLPNLTFAVKVKRVFRDRAGVIHEQDAGSHVDSDFYAVICAIKNELSTERKVGELADVSAHINYRSFTYDDGFSVDRGLWLGMSAGKVTIPRNATLELIIAINEKDEFFAASYLNVPIEGRISTRISLNDFLFPADVEVKLISEIEGSVVAREGFVLDRHAYINEADLVLAPIAEWRQREIDRYVNVGNDLFQQAAVLPNELDKDSRRLANKIKDEYTEWIQDVGLFLDQFWDTDHRATFIGQTISLRRDMEHDLRNYITSSEHSVLSKRILAKLYVLYRFQHELEDEIEKTKTKQ